MEPRPVLKQGWLRKKAARVNMWADRYFTLGGGVLSYSLREGDEEPKGAFALTHECTVSDIRAETIKRKRMFVFKLNIPSAEEEGEPDAEGDVTAGAAPGAGPRRPRKLPVKKKDEPEQKSQWSTAKITALAAGSVVLGALTVGVGLAVGLAAIGLTAGAGAGGAAVYNSYHKKREARVISLATETFEEADAWVNAIKMEIHNQDVYNGTFTITPARPPPPETHLEEVEHWTRSTEWKLAGARHGIRLSELSDHKAFSSKASMLPCRKVQIPISASPQECLTSILDMHTQKLNGVIRAFEVIEKIDDHSDVVYISLAPVFLSPTMTAARDFCLTRYWRQDEDGSIVVCLDSTNHPDCPLIRGKVRGDLHGVYLISPPKDYDGEEEPQDCMLTCICQIDPRGWIWRSLGYTTEFLNEFLMHVLDIRDALEADRFLQVHLDPTAGEVDAAIAGASPEEGGIEAIPAPALAPHFWAEPHASSFRVRGGTYLTDRTKVASADALMRLLCVDVFEVPEPTPNIASHPQNRVTLARLRGDTSFVFVIQIMVPGPPYFAFVVYLTPKDPTIFEQDTPFTRIAKPFFFGDDDTYRDHRFKLIPKIVDGNIVVRIAVKDTPAILGTKLAQTYHRGENYFELDVDVGSSSVAREIVRVAIGYSKAIVVDMGFVLEGKAEDELPEVLMGCVRCVNVDMSTARPLAAMPGSPLA